MVQHGPSPACARERTRVPTHTCAAGTLLLYPVRPALHNKPIFTPNGVAVHVLSSARAGDKKLPAADSAACPPSPTVAVRPRLRPGPGGRALAKQQCCLEASGLAETGCQDGKPTFLLAWFPPCGTAVGAGAGAQG